MYRVVKRCVFLAADDQAYEPEDTSTNQLFQEMNGGNLRCSLYRSIQIAGIVISVESIHVVMLVRAGQCFKGQVLLQYEKIQSVDPLSLLNYKSGNTKLVLLSTFRRLSSSGVSTISPFYASFFTFLSFMHRPVGCSKYVVWHKAIYMSSVEHSPDFRL